MMKLKQYRSVLVVGPSGSGKSTLAKKIDGDNRFVVYDLDHYASSSVDGVSNTYQPSVVAELLMFPHVGKTVVCFGLASNIVEIIKWCRRHSVLVVNLAIDADTLVKRRTDRGKPFDRSLDEHGHRVDFGMYTDRVARHCDKSLDSKRLIRMLTDERYASQMGVVLH